MIEVLPLSPRNFKFLKTHSLEKKFKKQALLLTTNPKHPSLHIERLEPKESGIYSFRIDRKYRALFFFHPHRHAIGILDITLHYR